LTPFTVRVASAVLVMLVASTSASAGNISLELSPQPQVSEGTLTVRLSVRNGGDEPGRSVGAALHFLSQTIRSEVRPLLRPGETWQAELALAAVHVGTGRWPYRISVDYADANEYPFQALHVGTVRVGAPPPAKLAVLEVTTPPLATSGSLKSRVKNLSPNARTVSIAVHLPEGIELAEPVAPIEFAAWEERRVTASLANRAGLPGSRYAVFVSAEYDDGPVHQVVVVPATLEIVAAQSVFKRRRSLLWVVAGLLVLAWGATVSWRLAARRRSLSDSSPK
jgi:hypothetical protein